MTSRARLAPASSTSADRSARRPPRARTAPRGARRRLEHPRPDPRGTTTKLAEFPLQAFTQTLGLDRDGRSRVELYRQDKPTQAQVDAARRALEARRRKQEKAFQSRRAREDPIARDLLDREFARLALDDPDGNIRRATARYPLDAILPGIAIFEAKRFAADFQVVSR